MSIKITAYGMVGGKEKYTYGPRNFDKDWNGVFTALEVISLLVKIPKVAPPISKFRPGPGIIAKSGALAQNIAKATIVEYLKLYLYVDGADYLYTIATITHWYKPDEWSINNINLSDESADIKNLSDFLTKYDLNTWGVLREITLALAGFFGTPKENGRSGLHVFLDA